MPLSNNNKIIIKFNFKFSMKNTLWIESWNYRNEKFNNIENIELFF
jgi:hypothetical protein